MLLRAFIHSLLWGGIIALTVLFGFFDKVVTDDGFEHYAEKPWIFLEQYIPWIGNLNMPGNTLVNIGYFIFAIYWLLDTIGQHHHHAITDHQAYMFYVLAWSTLMYAPVQIVRILTQDHSFAIMDQWYTLPLFAWVIVWSYYISVGWYPLATIMIMTLSTCSYGFALIQIPGYEDKGYEVALAIHICVVVYFAFSVYRKYESQQAFNALLMGVICCCGFVGLKLLDHKLAKMHHIFTVLSGHFWSKIADFLQFHYAGLFFKHVTNTMNEHAKKGK